VRRSLRPLLSLLIIFVAVSFSGRAAAPIRYRFTFPEPEHRWMQVEAQFSELDSAPLELHMSRSSPGRYSVHEFAKNVYDVHALDADGRDLPVTRPDPNVWTVTAHGAALTLAYKIFGDRVDGTYLAVDTTHAHINMPAALMWARGLDDRPAVLTFVRPANTQWGVATQLHPGANALEFTAPNLQYLMDSPVEFGPLAMREFSVGPRTFRFALHQIGDGQLDPFVRDVEAIVREEGAIFGEYPEYEPGSYTFLADYLPFADHDGMEHRNSTVMTASLTIGNGRGELLDTVAHEFFHCWNVERIRPRELEPFDLDRANITADLWLAEGFTEYYGPLALRRAGLVDLAETARTFSRFVDLVKTGPGRLVRSAEEMSRMAPFIDRGTPADRTNWSTTVISYYPFGGAIALALDLTLRERSQGPTTLDDFMRAMWRAYGKPGGSREGYVDRPYTTADVETQLSSVTNDASFAHDFIARYVQGHEIADYERLVVPAGFVVRKRDAGRAWWGDVRVESHGGTARVADLVAATWPAYSTGIEQDDTLVQMGGQKIASPEDVNDVLRRHRPGDRLSIAFVDRAGVAKSSTMTLAEDPHVEIVPIETTGRSPTEAQRQFRDRWLNSAASK